MRPDLFPQLPGVSPCFTYTWRDASCELNRGSELSVIHCNGWNLGVWFTHSNNYSADARQHTAKGDDGVEFEWVPVLFPKSELKLSAPTGAQGAFS